MGTFRDAVETLHRKYRHLPLDERKRIAQDVIERYIDELDSVSLRRLGDFLLIDILTDQYKHTRKYDYPFLTQKQIARRDARTTPLNDNDAY